MHCIQDSVDELHGFFAGEFPRQFQCFIDHYDRRRVERHHLVDGEAQDVAVHGGHTLDAPVLGVGGDAAVDFGDIGSGTFHQLFQEMIRRRAHGAFFGVKDLVEGRQGVRDRLLVDVPQEQGLQSTLTGTTAGGHGISSRADGA